MENLEEILDVDAFYANIDSKEKLLEFCNRLHAKCAKSLGIKPTGVKSAELEHPARGQIGMIGTNSVMRYLMPGFTKITMSNWLLNDFEQAKSEKDKIYIYMLAETILHETRHMWQVDPKGKEKITDKWVNLADLSHGVERWDSAYELLFKDMFTKGPEAVKEKLAENEGRRAASYFNHIWEIDAREYTSVELFKVYQKTKDEDLLEYLYTVAEDEEIMRRSPGEYMNLYDLPETLEDKWSSKTWKYVRNAVWGKTTREKGEIAATELAEKIYGEETHQKYRKLQKAARGKSYDDDECDPVLDELYDAQDILNEREKQVIEEMFPTYKIISAEAERVFYGENESEMSR